MARGVHAGSAVVALCLGAGVLSSGCGRGHAWGVGGEGGSKCEIVRLECDGRLFLVLAANGCSGGSSGGGDSIVGAGFRGKLHALDGREIAWSCSTRDGTAGTVTVDGQRLDLGKGGVLLVSTADQKTNVEQLAVDMSKLQGASGPRHGLREKLQALGDAEPRIAEFFKESRAGE